MTTNALLIPADPDRTVDTLRHEAVEMLPHADGELILDFCSVLRIDAAAAGAMEELAGLADRSSTRIVLRGVNIGIYRALKLLSLAHRFSFVS
jgi:anti-anti-sigma regulatory factor